LRSVSSDDVQRLLRDATKVVCLRLTLVETLRLIRRAVTEKRLDEIGSTTALEAFARAGQSAALLVRQALPDPPRPEHRRSRTPSGRQLAFEVVPA
jgi:hypothetical protein